MSYYAQRQRQQPEDESIYNLISRPQEQATRASMHRSRYPHDTPPTGSTFRRSTTSQVFVTNIAGNYNDVVPVKQPHANFGPRVSSAPDTTSFLRKATGVVTMRGANITKPHEVPVFHYSDRRKEQVSTHLEGELKSTFDRVEAESHGQYAKPKNFIAENAIKAITMRPPSENTPEWHTNYKKRPGFGEIPSYLSTVKSEIAAEKEQVRTVMAQERNAQRRASPQMRVMSEEERQLMLTSLKQKWEAVNKQYQTITHIVTLDTIGKIRRKEEYEQQLIQLERSIEKLSKKVVYVYDDLSNEQQVAV